MKDDRGVTRRAWIHQGAISLAGSAFAAGPVAGASAPNDDPARPLVRIGLVTDLHYTDSPPKFNRYYRETPAKLAEAAGQFRRDKTDLVVALGDLIDVGESLQAEQAFLRRIAKDLRATPGQHHFVLGNHCVWNLTKQEFLGIVGQKRSHYSFDLKGCHFVVLDACFRSDGQPYGRQNFQWTDANVPPAEVQWLRADLKRTANNAIVFIHQRLDTEPPLGVKNAAEVRGVLEESGKVLAVFQGHDHRGDFKQISRIAYCTLIAMVEGSGSENNAYAVADVLPGDVVRVTGFRRQRSFSISRPHVPHGTTR